MGSQPLLQRNVFLVYQEGRSLFLYMMQGLNSLFKTVTVTGHTRVSSPKERKKIPGIPPGAAPSTHDNGDKAARRREAGGQHKGPPPREPSPRLPGPTGLIVAAFCGTFRRTRGDKREKDLRP